MLLCPLPRYTALMASSRDNGDSEIEPGDAIDYGPMLDFAGYRIKLAYGFVFQSFTEMFSELNLAFGQYSVLLLIGLNRGISQLALAQASGLDGSTIVPITERFARLGWIRRIRRKDDRRFYSLRITPSGQEILDKARPLIEKHDRELLAPLTKRERETFMILLERITSDRVAMRVGPTRRSRSPRLLAAPLPATALPTAKRGARLGTGRRQNSRRTLRTPE
jgi:DNA-binding MarR family transcriptional regulator